MRSAWIYARRGLHRLRADQCGTGTVELVIAMPLLLLMLLLGAQFALYMHATHIAQAAAAQALSMTRVSGGSTAAGYTKGQQILSQLGSGPLRETSMEIQRGPARASVTVTGTVIALIPLTTFSVQAEAVGPVEKFTPPTGDEVSAP
ncbi:TadE/TadG family type IV pilus assembly protein [Lentzea albidocapillata]|uniref:TadE/TadG family type IV pilus assembly protein n=1 Tax=Lentzea albidocapillata TaxID=40571 RepID=UPI001FE66441|nr:TadE/TadG family type IV pilus assembly protein [Lentzea albidocapillata]